MRGIIHLSLVLVGSALVQAQSTQHATCETGFQWSFNSRNQSPCAITESLGGVCNGGVFTVPPLGEEQVYRGPDPTAANSCRCSMVFYAMVSTCAACQGQSWVTWSSYNANCTNVYVGFPQGIPAGTAVPNYAYQNFTRTDKFDITIAQEDSGPESVAPSGTGTPRASQSSGGGGGGTNAGAIAGGVVGGVVGLGIIAGVVFWLLRRRNAQRNTVVPVNPSSDPLTPPPMSYVGGSNMDYPTTPPPKLYVSTKLYGVALVTYMFFFLRTLRIHPPSPRPPPIQVAMFIPPHPARHHWGTTPSSHCSTKCLSLRQ
ncbi:hypothetical protein PTI98_003030 [Pleurotus ostreatus]|nr:hypothetical protein PTI98_003030 [Pleurotus ostreatus]